VHFGQVRRRSIGIERVVLLMVMLMMMKVVDSMKRTTQKKASERVREREGGKMDGPVWRRW